MPLCVQRSMQIVVQYVGRVISTSGNASFITSATSRLLAGLTPAFRSAARGV